MSTESSAQTSEIPPPGDAARPQSGRSRDGRDKGSPVREGSHVVVVGGGPGGYEAALVAARLGAHVTVIERQGLGGAAVLTDVVPSKTLIATAEWMTITERASELGIRSAHAEPLGGRLSVDLHTVNERVLNLARRQSDDIRGRLERDGIEVVIGEVTNVSGLSSEGTRRIAYRTGDAEQGRQEHTLVADIVLLSTGARPRVLPGTEPDGERVLSWVQLYGLTELPEHLIVVGSGVTGAEFAGAYNALGTDVTLVSSRDRVLPGEDSDAAELIESVFRRRGMNVLSRSRAASVRRHGEEVTVELTDGRTVTGSHCLVAVGAVPNTEGIGLQEAGIALTSSGHVEVDRVSRTTGLRVYAAGDCTGTLPLASVAAMQGRIAMWHALGDAVQPLDLRQVAATIFTAPEIATIGVPEAAVTSGEIDGVVSYLPLERNPRAKMMGVHLGFVKVITDRASDTVIGGVVVAPRASELIYPLTLAVTHRLTAAELSAAYTIYPSISGSISEAARVAHSGRED